MTMPSSRMDTNEHPLGVDFVIIEERFQPGYERGSIHHKGHKRNFHNGFKLFVFFLFFVVSLGRR
jgi:hypothetical protein